MSISGINSNNSSPYLCVKHPVAINILQLYLFLYSAISKIVSIDSCFALSINPHVLTIIISASLASFVIS